MKLSKHLAERGHVVSMAEGRRLISFGRVAVNGVLAHDDQEIVDQDVIEVKRSQRDHNDSRRID